ncbi:hypothetical protein [uncultured Campylobacter sp.]|uniref:hypothetical protein n=1 Tax=uncultured Campylobacter sp. TaxID=218934 RepID=UPI00262E501E|nr:hypothetical protein [uncultured Campylobacter sp.]
MDANRSFTKISNILKQIADNTTSYKDADEVLGYYKDRFESFENIINNPELGANDDIKFNKYGKINEWLVKRQKRIEYLKSKNSFDFSSLLRVFKTLDRALSKIVCELIAVSFKANNQSENLTREFQQLIARRGTVAVAQAQAKGKKAALNATRKAVKSAALYGYFNAKEASVYVKTDAAPGISLEDMQEILGIMARAFSYETAVSIEYVYDETMSGAKVIIIATSQDE